MWTNGSQDHRNRESATANRPARKHKSAKPIHRSIPAPHRRRMPPGAQANNRSKTSATVTRRTRQEVDRLRKRNLNRGIRIGRRRRRGRYPAHLARSRAVRPSAISGEGLKEIRDRQRLAARFRPVVPLASDSRSDRCARGGGRGRARAHRDRGCWRAAARSSGG